jgi:putative hemolysin
VELRSEPNGTVGYCHLPDGRVVEEWALFRAGADKSGE